MEYSNHNILSFLSKEWYDLLNNEFEKPYFRNIVDILKTEKEQGNIIYPPENEIFSAFNLTPFNKIKVVIIGQDPYHGQGQAHGLCFSVKNGIIPPPSLINIFKEISANTGASFSTSGDLSSWAKQGVLLLNAILTVKANQPGSHQKLGWEQFTNAVISLISEKKDGVIFLLWGKFAESKALLIDENKHYFLKAPHPSPYSANSGFFGCKHFSKTNEILRSLKKEPINWGLIG